MTMKDFHYAIRQMVNRPGLSVLVIVMLALGIGATTAMFSLYNEFLLRPLPVPAPNRLVNLGAPGPKWGGMSCTNLGDCKYVFSYPMFRDLEARQTVFTGLAGHSEFTANLSYEARTLSGNGELVSGEYFKVLELQPALGRLIGPQDEPKVGESAVVVLSYRYWQTHFGGDRSVVGRTLTVNGQPLEIIGVAPAGFSGASLGGRPQVFVPLTLRWLMQPTVPKSQGDRRAYWVYLFARLKRGASVEQASAGINGIYSAILNDVEAPLNAETAMPDDILERFRQRRVTVEPGARGQSEIPEHAEQPVTLLFGLTALVLLIVCFNIANLLLARGASRAGEMAVRASIGASRGLLVRQLLTEAGLLAVIGGVLSVPVAVGTLRVFLSVAPEQAANFVDARLSPEAMIFAAGATLLTVLLFGLVPALQATRADTALIIKSQAPQSVGGTGLARFRGVLATAQITFAMVLLVLAGLFARSLMNIARVDLGMDVDSLVTFRVSPRLNGYEPERVMSLYDRIEGVLAAQPGVTAVASSAVPLISNSNRRSGVTVDGFEGGPNADTNVSLNWVSPSFFRTLSIPLLSGRGLAETDTLNSPRVAVVNESFVRKFNLGDDALGTHFSLPGPDSGDEITIVGVVADAKYSTVKDEIPPQFFAPRRQNDNLGSLSFYVHGAVDPSALLRMVPRAVSGVDSNLPVSGLRTMRTEVRNNVFLDGLATLLAAIGLYGVLAYNVTQRTREMGLRLALGATPGRLRSSVLGQVGRMGLIGGLIGVVAAIGLGRAAAALLYGLRGYEPAVLAFSVIVLAAVVFAAGFWPARRASRVAPMEALRYE
jgi:predicted permease